ncbi:glycine decarboxylase subunit T [Saccharomycopsis crataegensis]|uniref:Aminomethyltransferase n=1 Tax=Saccharomycopsis crataegensis TaxID=43959 RepID=A0AAV5QMD1_9ASCO|nr:glycine decarboxylase subunit T [Saccharomycopsis crataegensis]
MSGALKTPFYDLHKRLGGKLVNYANYLLPISYPSQTHIESHLHVRSKAGIFDVSHMLQHRLVGAEASKFLESLVPTDIGAVKPGSCHLSTFLNDKGGVVDDTIITKVGENEIYFVSNGATSDKISAYITAALNEFQNGSHGLKYDNFKKSLVAIQGPTAHLHLSKALKTDLSKIFFGNHFFLENGEKVIGKGFTGNFSENSNGLLVSRSGYTGEDGFELSIPNPELANEVVEKLLQDSEVQPIGLAARDSLRLEAGMCLYGNELTEDITPVEASLNWIISKSRRTADAGFKGAEKVLAQLNDKSLVPYKRVGFTFEGGAAARTGSKIFANGEEVGFVSSGSQSPSLSDATGKKMNIGQGFIKMPFHKKETDIEIQVRKKTIAGKVKKLPLVESHYYKPE